MTQTRWTVERLGQMSADLVFRASGKRERFSVLLMSDEHADNLQADLGLIRKHHQQAVDAGAPILKLGDTMCAMEGKWDKRASESHLRPEMRGGNYLDRLVSFHAELCGQYARNIAIISDGNHETAMLKHHQTDLLERLVSTLRQGGSPALHMPFTGFVRFRFADKHSHADSKVLHYHHGYGGGGEVTRGLIDNSRTRGQYLADVHYSGHIHRRNYDENVLMALDRAGNVVEKTQLFLRGSCYKREHMDGGGYHVEKGRAGRPLGGWWLHFDVQRTQTVLMVSATAEAAT
jgi:hypothetical protein